MVIATFIMAIFTGCMAWESRANRIGGRKEKEKQAFRAALTDVVNANLHVTRMIEELTTERGHFLNHFLSSNQLREFLGRVGNLAVTEALLKQVGIPSDVVRYLLVSVGKMRGVVCEIEDFVSKKPEEFVRSETILMELKWIHLILTQLGRVLLVEAKSRSHKEVEGEVSRLLTPSSCVGDICGEDVENHLAYRSPLGEISLPQGSKYRRIRFEELIREAKSRRER